MGQIKEILHDMVDKRAEYFKDHTDPKGLEDYMRLNLTEWEFDFYMLNKESVEDWAELRKVVDPPKPPSDLTKEQIHRINFTKSIFKTYFDGCYDVEPEIPNLPTMALGITHLDFRFVKPTPNSFETLVMSVTLLRPGLLIGKAGSTIDALTTRLNTNKQEPVKIEIIESKLWDFIKE